MIYRKQGRVVRWENGTVVRVTESGVAVEEGEVFRCWPDRTDRTDRTNGTDETETSRSSYQSYSSHLSYLSHQIAQATAHVTVERLLLIHGHAHHQYGDRSWSEEIRRLHLSLVKGTMRVLIDQADFDTAEIAAIAGAFARAETDDRQPPPRLRLAPNVTAALLPTLVTLAPPNVRILQTAGGIDGKGHDIVEADKDWPNWYRPSYRVRPVRAPLNLRLECDVTLIEEERPIAIALLAPVEGTTLRVLVEEGSRVYPSAVRITRIDAVAAERRIYPYGAGSFGAEMML